MPTNEDSEQSEQLDFAKLALATIAGVLILTGAVYAAYRYSQRQSSNIILPGGVTYLGPSPKPSSQPPTAPLRFTANPDVNWLVQKGRVYPFSFSYPETLPLAFFPNDPTDSVAISWGNIPPQVNILLNMEMIDKRDPKFQNLSKMEYVKNWYKFFSGLKGVEKVEPFTNANGMKGYKASYLNYTNQAPNLDVFIEIPNEPNLLIHLANGILDPAIFEKIVDSLKWTPKTATKPTR